MANSEATTDLPPVFSVDIGGGFTAVCREVCFKDLSDARGSFVTGEVEKFALFPYENRVVILLSVQCQIPGLQLPVSRRFAEDGGNQ